ARDFTQQSPYTRVMDAARADQKVARDFRRLVHDFLTNGADDADMAAQIRSRLRRWADNHERLVAIINVSPVLREIESLSADLKTISLVGLELMDAIAAGEKISAARASECADALTEAGRQRGQVELQVVEPIEKLLQRAQ
ncbi:beta-hexosaminidase, partial [candidate division KSB1 bacterium]|nr:beta-hexosaminidase [candidate division KSB1 bacterium]